MNGNMFELTGRVNYINLDYSQSGNAYCRVLISKKAGKDSNEYRSMPIVFFGKNAEHFANNVDKGDTVNVKGMLSSEEDKNTKKITAILVGLESTVVVYDENQRDYIPKIVKDVDEEASKAQGELPWKKSK